MCSNNKQKRAQTAHFWFMPSFVVLVILPCKLNMSKALRFSDAANYNHILKNLNCIQECNSWSHKISEVYFLVLLYSLHYSSFLSVMSKQNEYMWPLCNKFIVIWEGWHIPLMFKEMTTQSFDEFWFLSLPWEYLDDMNSFWCNRILNSTDAWDPLQQYC